jgi:hypothetical protein
MLRRSLGSLIPYPTLVNFVQGTWVLAGSTITLSGTIADSALRQFIPDTKPTAVHSALQAPGEFGHIALIGRDSYVNDAYA